MELSEAKKIVISLANGIDPITGELFPNDSPYNHPLVIRALFTIAGTCNHNPPKLNTQSLDDKQLQNLASGKPKNAGMPWTEDLKQEVAALFHAGQPINKIAAYFERTEGAIRAELIHQGLVDPKEK
jgi:hypothetical protein